MIDQSGLVRALVNLSARQAEEKGLLTSGTYGPIGSGSSSSIALQSSLASKLQQKLSCLGSTLYKLTWKERVTPLGRLICALRASGRRTSDKDCGSWRSPNQSDGEGGAMDIMRAKREGLNPKLKLRDQSLLASWPTPMAGTPAQKGYNEAGNTDSSRKTVALVGSWPKPKQSDSDKGARSHRGAMKELNRKGPGSDLPTMAAATWATPSSRDFKSNEGSPEFHAARMKQARGKPLSEQAHQLAASWATPKSTDGKGDPYEKQSGDRRVELRQQVFGATPSGSPASTAKPGQLNPAFSLYLMGYSQSWIVYSPFKNEV